MVLLVVLHHELCVMGQKKDNHQTIVAIVLRRGVVVLWSETVVDVGHDAVRFERILADDTLGRPAIRHHPASAVAEEDQLMGLSLLVRQDRFGSVCASGMVGDVTGEQIDLGPVSDRDRRDISNDTLDCFLALPKTATLREMISRRSDEGSNLRHALLVLLATTTDHAHCQSSLRQDGVQQSPREESEEIHKEGHVSVIEADVENEADEHQEKKDPHHKCSTHEKVISDKEKMTLYGMRRGFRTHTTFLRSECFYWLVLIGKGYSLVR